MTENNKDLTEEYAAQIKPLLDLAKRAYGPRTHSSPAHVASRRYTELLVEYYGKGGSLVSLASELGVTYAGMRRRVVTANLPVTAGARSSLSPEETESAIERILAAKARGTDDYHQQLHKEYMSGVSFAKVAAALKISSSQPLYHGMNKERAKGK
jgi:hypothetical protein